MATTLVENRKNGVNIKRLTPNERMFVLALMAQEDWNLAAAVKVAYPKCKNPAQYGTKLMHRPKIKALLGKFKREREERTQLTSDAVWEYLHRVLFFDPKDVYKSARPGWWEIKSLEEMSKEHRQMIEGIDVKSVKVDGEDVLVTIVKFVAKSRALDIAARHCIAEPPKTVNLQMFADWDALRGDGRNEPDLVEAAIETKFIEKEDE